MKRTKCAMVFSQDITTVPTGAPENFSSGALDFFGQIGYYDKGISTRLMRVLTNKKHQH